MFKAVHFVLRPLLYPVLFLFALVTVLIAIQVVRIHQQNIPGIPWVGLRNRKICPKLRACLGELAAGRTMIVEGWQKASKYLHSAGFL